jgi:hypothetical protein
MKQIAIQYLESRPELAARPVDAVRQRLRIAGERLPISNILIGWHLPHHLLEACHQETGKLGAKFYRWHPLLTGDGTFYPCPEWRVIGLNGEPIAGFQDMPEFTFVCPNRPAAAEAVLRRVDEIISSGDYDGVFLDRIRFPSPASNPAAALGCFCKSCQQAATQKDLDLAEIRTTLQEWVKKPSGRCDLVRILLKPPETQPDTQQAQALQTFIKFRSESITAFVSKVVDQFHANGLLVGLDCFSPMLAPMVGQDLSALGKPVDWVKLMSYAHTLGPAGLPFELLELAEWLTAQADLNTIEAMQFLINAVNLPLPNDPTTLRRKGLSSQALQLEVKRGLDQIDTPVLFGVELVEIEGVAELDSLQIREDLSAVHAMQPAGLALSWDLWDMPLERLDLVREIWFMSGN